MRRRLSLVLALLLAPQLAAAQSWTAPRTWTTGELVTASILNTHIRDNELVLRAGGFSVTSQAIGDLLCASSTTQFARLADVATGSVLISGGVGACPSYSTLLALGNGSTTTPTYAFSADTNSGMYSVADNVIGFVTNGTERWRIGAGGNLIPVGGATNSVGDSTNTVLNVFGGTFQASNGSNASPSHTFVSDTDTGMYRVGADNLAFAVGGTRGWGIDNSQAAAWTNSAGNIVDPQGTPSVTAGGGTGAAVSAGKDYSFRGTTGSTASTTLTVTFERTFTSAPSCSANLSSTNAVGVATTTTTVVLTYASVTSNNFFVICRGF